jgi:hypothetical protein
MDRYLILILVRIPHKLAVVYGSEAAVVDVE